MSNVVLEVSVGVIIIFSDNNDVRESKVLIF